MKNRFSLLLTALMLCFTLQLNAQNKNAKPFVIPELREWVGATGEFEITEATKVVYSKSQPQAGNAAQLFVFDYRKMTGTSLKFVEGKAGKGDILISIKNNKKLGNEGYKITIGNNVKIEATTERGAIWATRTLL